MEGNALPAKPNPPQLRNAPPLSATTVKKGRSLRDAPPLSSNFKKSLPFRTRRIQGDGPSHSSRPQKSYGGMVTNAIRNPAKKATRSAPGKVFSPDELQRSDDKLRTLQAQLRKTQMEVTDLQGSIAKIEKQVRNLCRLKRRAMEHEIRVTLLGQDGSASDSGRIEAWADDIVKHQQAARAAGLAWSRHRFDDKRWSERSAESKNVFAQAYGYFFMGLARWQLHPAALAMIENYDTLPMQPNSGELAKARVRMIREMIVEGELAQEMTKGLMVSEQEGSEAMIGLAETRNGVYEHSLQEPGFYKLKSIDWSGVFDWSGIKLHKLPLRRDPEEDEDMAVPQSQPIDKEKEECGVDDDETPGESKGQDEDEEEEYVWKILETMNNYTNFGVWETLTK
ncbi:MAG: hypothetical protein Q9228_003473 [Teloschistes exilis]